VALGGLRGLPPLFPLSTFCFRLSLSGGFARLFKVRGSRFEVQSSVFSISVPNTTALSRLPRRGLGAPWTYHGTIDHQHSPIFKQASLSQSKSASSASGSRPPRAPSS
jgi:hypothetical protein